MIITKYPRTKHLEDSKLQPGDEGMGGITFQDLPDDATYVYEEKVDGANSGFSFDAGGIMFAQSRGHFLQTYDRNFSREDDWKLFKDWLIAHEDEFLDRFEDRYLIYGEWCGIVHSVFYDRLPHYFLEFDILDKTTGEMLSTEERKKLLDGLPIVSVPVLYQGPKTDLKHLKSLAMRQSEFQTPNQNHTPAWLPNLEKACQLVNDNFDDRIKKMVTKPEMEGIYIKVEKDGKVIDRYKWVNPNFTQTIENSNEHWQSRFPVPNLLVKQTDIFPSYLVGNNLKKKENDLKIY